MDQKIYIWTYKRSPGGKSLTEFLISDTKGKLLKKVRVPLKYGSPFTPYTYTIKSGKLYQFVEDDDEGWELHIEEIK